MQKSDFYYDLPHELIAQTPLINRQQSRLLCMDKQSGVLTHRHFYDLPELLHKGDCLILNDSRVLPARLLGVTDSGHTVEVLLLRETGNIKDGFTFFSSSEQMYNFMGNYTIWECLTKPGKKTKEGVKIVFGNGELTATVNNVNESGNRMIEFNYDGNFLDILDKLGKTPLPPYIYEELTDAERYQTVYSKEAGSSAAPTAGLHFTRDLLNELLEKGVEVCYVTLHVGLGTFRPVKSERIEEHDMHAEYYVINEETAGLINNVKKHGGRVVAVGTTSCRVLESCTDEKGMVSAYCGFTDIFIYPGYSFKCIDGLITNFHLPESTLIMLVSAFAGRTNTLNAYEEAIREKYRFFSFGDACLIL